MEKLLLRPSDGIDNSLPAALLQQYPALAASEQESTQRPPLDVSEPLEPSDLADAGLTRIK